MRPLSPRAESNVEASTDDEARRASLRVASRLAVGLALLLPVLAVVLPIVSEREFRGPGPVPRHTLLDTFGWAPVAAIGAIPIYVLVIVSLDRWAVSSRRPMAAGLGLVLSGILTIAALVGFVTFIIGLYALPAAVACLVTSGLARSSARNRNAGASNR